VKKKLKEKKGGEEVKEKLRSNADATTGARGRPWRP
jgi:hypothetical protein